MIIAWASPFLWLLPSFYRNHLIYFSLFIIIILLLLSLIIDRVFFVFFSLIHLIVNLNIYRSANEFNRYSHKHSSSIDSMQVDPHSFTNSFFQVDPNNPSIITLPDGTTAQVQGVATVGPLYRAPIARISRLIHSFCSSYLRPRWTCRRTASQR